MAANRNLANRFRPTLDALESRDLMSVTSVVLSAGVLKVTLNNGNDNVRIADHFLVASNSTAAAKASVVSTTGTSTTSLAMLNNTGAIDSVFAGTVTVTDLTRPNATWTFSRAAVHSIEVDNHNSYGDNNTIISTSSLPTTVDLRNSKGTNWVQTGAGNDRVYGSDGNDRILLGDGDDYAEGGLGNDIINGGRGSDVLLGGGGSDTLVDNLSSTDANLLYGDADNDIIFSASKNDVIDGGAGFDTASVKIDTYILRNVESTQIIDVPLGHAVTNVHATFLQAANRYLESYGLPTIGQVDGGNQAGWTSSNELDLVRQVKPDAQLLTGVHRETMATVLLTGRPVISRFNQEWVVYNGYNSATKMFSFVSMDGHQYTTALSPSPLDMIYSYEAK